MIMKNASTAKKSSTNKRTGSRSLGTGKRTATTNTTRKIKNSTNNSISDTDSSPFEELFIDMLKDVYWAEQHLTEALKKMTEAATTDELQTAFEDHLFITQKHASRLERIFNLLGKPAEAQKCDAMEALVKEAEKVIKNTPAGSMTRDAGLIISAQKVEHYEIATYGSLVQVALTLGYDQAAYILEKTLTEEEDTDSLLTQIAEYYVNPMADIEDESEDGVMQGQMSEMVA
jgi:ferritin-like metal-binding protein YciE